jgi:hypothetical protein
VNYFEFKSHELNGFLGDPSCECPACGDSGHFAEDMASVFKALERSRVFGVIEGFKLAHPEWSEISGINASGGYRFRLGPLCIDRENADAARTEAARAIEAREVA